MSPFLDSKGTFHLDPFFASLSLLLFSVYESMKDSLPHLLLVLLSVFRPLFPLLYSPSSCCPRLSFTSLPSHLIPHSDSSPKRLMNECDKKAWCNVIRFESLTILERTIRLKATSQATPFSFIIVISRSAKTLIRKETEWEEVRKGNLILSCPAWIVVKREGLGGFTQMSW